MGFYDRFYFSNYDGLMRLADLTGSTTAKPSNWSFWTKTKMGVALSYTGPIYWVGLILTNTVYYTFFGITAAATWCATNLNLSRLPKRTAQTKRKRRRRILKIRRIRRRLRANPTLKRRTEVQTRMIRSKTLKRVGGVSST